MARTRILILHSLRERESERHARQMAESPRLKAYEIEHLYAADDIGLDLRFDLKAMGEKLSQRIEIFRPDIVFIHVGMAYYSSPARYIDIVNGLIKQYPWATFVADRHLPPGEGFLGMRPGEIGALDVVISELIDAS